MKLFTVEKFSDVKFRFSELLGLKVMVGPEANAECCEKEI